MSFVILSISHTSTIVVLPWRSMSGNLYFFEVIVSSSPPTFTRDNFSGAPQSFPDFALSLVMKLIDDALSRITFAYPAGVFTRFIFSRQVSLGALVHALVEADAVGVSVDSSSCNVGFVFSFALIDVSVFLISAIT